MPVVEMHVTITNKVGLHARPAGLFVQTAARFQSKVQVEHGEKTANARSIIAVMKLGASQGDTLLLRVEGEDAEEAVRALVDLVQRKFDEGE